MTCDRCTPSSLCLNHEAEAKSAAFLRARDEREAIARGSIRYARNAKAVRGWT
jgi:hypothetical protein